MEKLRQVYRAGPPPGTVTPVGLGETQLSKATDFKVCKHSDSWTATVLTLYPLPPQETCRALPALSLNTLKRHKVKQETVLEKRRALLSLQRRQPEPFSPPTPTLWRWGEG